MLRIKLMTLQSWGIALLACTLLFTSTPSEARKAFVNGTIIRATLQDAEYYGFCMARLGPGVLATGGFDCPADPLVTFDCEGNFGSKSAGTTNFSGAQLAFVAEKTVNVLVDDSKKINGFCYASRIDVF